MKRAPHEAHALSRHVPALDGLRGVSVLAVLLYHAEVPWLPGGFLGVDVFFVLSGFLITALLCREKSETGRIDLPGFYVRRIRRLMPALITFLFGTLVYVWLRLPDERNAVALDALSALTYTTNAHLVFGARSYFEEALRPSLLKHLWSLAVEEQFYLLYPPVCALLFLRWPARIAAGVASVLALLSGLRMEAVFDPLKDPSRAYYGTDSHAFGLLFGAALAFACSRSVKPGRAGEQAADSRSPVRGFIVSLAAALVLLAFITVDESESYVFRGGIVAVSLAAALVVASIGRGAPRWLERALSVRPMVWLGEISYSLYLFHWPVCVLLNAALRDIMPSTARITVVVTLSVILAALSRQYVELPFLRSVRRGGDSLSGPHLAQRRLALSMGALLSVAAGVLLLWSDIVVGQPAPLVADAAMLGADTEELPTVEDSTLSVAGELEARDQGEDEAVDLAAELASDNAELAASAPTQVGQRANEPPAADTRAATLRTPDTTPNDRAEVGEDEASGEAKLGPAPVPASTFATALLRRDCAEPFGLRPKQANTHPEALAVGDSVMLGAARSIWARNPRIEIDACVGRNASAASHMLQERAHAQPLPPTVIVHIGNNGGLNQAQIDDMMRTLSPVQRICFVTTRVPRRSQERTNSSLRRTADAHAHVVLADWFAYTEAQETLFRQDGVHLTGQGARAYANFVVDQCLNGK